MDLNLVVARGYLRTSGRDRRGKGAGERETARDLGRLGGD